MLPRAGRRPIRAPAGGWRAGRLGVAVSRQVVAEPPGHAGEPSPDSTWPVRDGEDPDRGRHVAVGQGDRAGGRCGSAGGGTHGHRSCRGSTMVTLADHGLPGHAAPGSIGGSSLAKGLAPPRGPQRTVPFGLLCVSLVLGWYAQHGQPAADLAAPLPPTGPARSGIAPSTPSRWLTCSTRSAASYWPPNFCHLTWSRPPWKNSFTRRQPALPTRGEVRNPSWNSGRVSGAACSVKPSVRRRGLRAAPGRPPDRLKPGCSSGVLEHPDAVPAGP
jgi:hypothetical protein